MISVIVPVYNVESCLAKCLDSIIRQTYIDLDIIIIDDGSTDGSGGICDKFAEADVRIRVFHTENRGLSAARNIGLDVAIGEWIGFVDADDWIEHDMYEELFKRAQEVNADLVECGWYRVSQERTERISKDSCLLSRDKAVHALINGTIDDCVWNKLWKKSCFEGVRFPNRRAYEDIATTCQVISKINLVYCVDVNKYHYRQRTQSISHTYSFNNLKCYWLSNKERSEVLVKLVDDNAKKELFYPCAIAAARIWAVYYDLDLTERDAYRDTVQCVNSFVKIHFPMFGDGSWALRDRIGVFFPHFYTDYSFKSAQIAYHFYKFLFQNDKKCAKKNRQYIGCLPSNNKMIEKH